MSGVVVKLNDDEEDEDEDDTGGLLSGRRGYDDEDEDDDDIGQKMNGGRAVLKRLRGDKNAPYPSMRSGMVMQLLNTLTICCVFFGMVRLYNKTQRKSGLMLCFRLGLDQILDRDTPVIEGDAANRKRNGDSSGLRFGIRFWWIPLGQVQPELYHVAHPSSLGLHANHCALDRIGLGH